MRIHICGIYGSGKTTLGKKLHDRLNLPIYELDDIKFISKWDNKRPIKERLKLLEKISKRKNWIIEGSWGKDAGKSFEMADVIIFLNIPKKVCQYRVLRRGLIGNIKRTDTFAGGIRLAKAINRYFNETNNLITHKEHLKIITKYKKKTIVIRKHRGIGTIIDEIKKRTKN